MEAFQSSALASYMHGGISLSSSLAVAILICIGGTFLNDLIGGHSILVPIPLILPYWWPNRYTRVLVTLSRHSGNLNLGTVASWCVMCHMILGLKGELEVITM